MSITRTFYDSMAAQYDKLFRDELTELLHDCGCRGVTWLFPEETGFYQPIVIARK